MQVAIVSKMKSNYNHEPVFICEDINEAYEWAEEHQDMLDSDEQYAIYYRYEKGS